MFKKFSITDKFNSRNQFCKEYFFMSIYSLLILSFIAYNPQIKHFKIIVLFRHFQLNLALFYAHFRSTFFLILVTNLPPQFIIYGK